ncbi:MAG: hypothetical protein IJQ08_09095 [Synergistaceae bacterium]|nr:hypothetical protein [Synergistaceae bacterium]
MAITILEALANEKPSGSKIRVLNETLRPIYRLIQKHMAEIEEAQSRGYSWRQINEVCRRLWQDDPEAKKIVWWKDPHMVAQCYYKVKHEKMPIHDTPAALKRASIRKYSVEVTEG